MFQCSPHQPCAAASQENRLARDLRMTAQQERRLDWISKGNLRLKEERPFVCSAYSPGGPRAGTLLPQSTRSHARPSCMVSMMDHANACTSSNRENNNAGFIFTEASAIGVSTKQMSLTLEHKHKFHFTTSAFQITTPRNNWSDARSVCSTPPLTHSPQG